jgi:hypothetical protein
MYRSIKYCDNNTYTESITIRIGDTEMVTKDNEIERGYRNGKSIIDMTRTQKRLHIIIKIDNYTKRGLYSVGGFFLASYIT